MGNVSPLGFEQKGCTRTVSPIKIRRIGGGLSTAKYIAMATLAVTVFLVVARGKVLPGHKMSTMQALGVIPPITGETLPPVSKPHPAAKPGIKLPL